MTKKGIKVEELGIYSNYEEQINNLSKRWEINQLSEEITNYIWDKIINKKPRNEPEYTNNFDDEWNNLKSELNSAHEEALKAEIKRLKNKKLNDDAKQREENQKKIAEKEQELTKIKEDDQEDNKTQLKKMITETKKKKP